MAIDACSDVTWGWTLKDTKTNWVNLVRAHLDRLGADPGHAYNCSVLGEFLWFAEAEPQRRAEAIEAIRSGRLYVSPFLNNTLYGWQSIESQWRSLWHARRLEVETGLDLFAVGQHIEIPSLSWCAAEVCAASGLRWLNVPYLSYEGVFAGIECPPIFEYESPSGRRLEVILDRFACTTGAYWQGAHVCHSPENLNTWVQHYQQQGSRYPWKALLASGMHSDTLADSWKNVDKLCEQVEEADGLRPDVEVRRSTYSAFVSDLESDPHPLDGVRGDFGCSWEGWLVSLAQLNSDAREIERRLLSAEARLAAASASEPSLTSWARELRPRTIWLHAMLADHAWNGCNDENRRENHRIRRAWVDELAEIASMIEAKVGKSEHVARTAPLDPSTLPPGFAQFRYDGPHAPEVDQKWDGESLTLQVRRPPHAEIERAMLALPQPWPDARLRLETGGAMVEPERDLLPGAERRWLAFQHVACWVGQERSLWIASPDAYLWRLDQGGIQLYGSDINPNEVSRDQAGEDDMRFRFAFRWVQGAWSDAEAVNWARSLAWPDPLFANGDGPVRADPARVVVSSLLASDDGPEGSVVLRLWELAGRTGPCRVEAGRWTRCREVDLLERPIGEPFPAPFDLPLRANAISAWRFEV